MGSMNSYEKGDFIENGRKASTFEWIFSKGTNYTCYEIFNSTLGEEERLNFNIDFIRTIIYSIHTPFKFIFFYWTMLLFILHKFNFKKPVMKIVLIHFILRATGDMLDKLGSLWSFYFANKCKDVVNGVCIWDGCQNESAGTEMHPMKWFITRQLGVFFWFTGEIAADYYPLIRARAVARDQKSIRKVYFACGLFNLTKVVNIIYHWFLSPSELYDEYGQYNKERINTFYVYYWIIHLFIIYTSVIYDFTVFHVLKKCVFKTVQVKSGFLKRFQTISEYRIYLSAIINIIFLPIVSVTIIFKLIYYYYHGYHNLNFSFDEIRQSLANFQYFMIFIDQILLLRSKNEATQTHSLNYLNNNYILSNNSNKELLNYNSNSRNQRAEPMSSIYKNRLMSYNLNDSPIDNRRFSFNTTHNLSNPNYSSNNNESNFNNSVSFDITNENYSRSNNSRNSLPRTSNNKSKTIANYDNYNGIKNDWSYLK